MLHFELHDFFTFLDRTS